MARILITDADNRSALAATRALGQAGHTVFTAGPGEPALAGVSRHSAGFDRYADPYHHPDAFVRDVAALIAAHSIDVLLPMTEITTLLLTRARDQLPPQVRIPFPDAETVALAADKSRVLALAHSIGIPIPATIVVNGPKDIDDAVARSAFPAVFKPARSRSWTGHEWVTSGTGYCTNADALRAGLQALHPAVFPVLIQERIQGPGVGVFLCRGDDGVLARFAHRRLREKPPSGGVSVLCESAEANPQALRQATELLDAIGWRGVAMVEFKHHLPDGSLRLMEINGRFWGSLQLAIDAGVNFPQLAVQIATGTATPVEGYRIGVRSRWWWGDVDAMLTLLLKSRESLNLPPDHPGRWRTLASFLRLWQSGTRYELERCDDRQPAWLAAKRWLTGR